eukprot:scaffold393_cov554-Prasinococcus_capsulatus_cf.AAC.6
MSKLVGLPSVALMILNWKPAKSTVEAIDIKLCPTEFVVWKLISTSAERKCLSHAPIHTIFFALD